MGVWKPKLPTTGTPGGRPSRARRAAPAAGSAGGGSGMPMGIARTRTPGFSSRTTPSAQALCTRTPRWRSRSVRWAGSEKTGAAP